MFFQFEIIINVFVSFLRFICIHLCYGSTAVINDWFFQCEDRLRCQNLTSTDVRFWCLISVPALTGLNTTIQPVWILILLYVAFCTIMAISRQKEARKAGTMPYSYFEWLQGFFIVHSTRGSTVHSMPLNSLEHCICITTMTNIRLDRDLNLVPPGYKPQSIRMNMINITLQVSRYCIFRSKQILPFGFTYLYVHVRPVRLPAILNINKKTLERIKYVFYYGRCQGIK